MKSLRIYAAFFAILLSFSIMMAGCDFWKSKDVTAKQKVEKGKKMISQKRPEDAIEEFKAAVTLEPASFEARYGLSEAYYQARDFKKAEDAVQSALKLRPKDPQAHNMLGLILQKMGLFDAAKKAFQQASFLDRKFQEPRANLANIEEAKAEYALSRFAADFIYVLSTEYSNGNNAFMKGLEETAPVRNEVGEVSSYEISSSVYLAQEYFEKTSRLLEESADSVDREKTLLDVINAFSAAIELRREAVDLQVAGYAREHVYAGEFERAAAKVKIADTYYVDAAKKLEELMLEHRDLFSEKEFEDMKYLITYYSQDKTRNAEAARR